MARQLTDEQLDQIKALVAEGGRTQQQIADAVGTSRQHVGRIARGEQHQDLDAGAVQLAPPVDDSVVGPSPVNCSASASIPV